VKPEGGRMARYKAAEKRIAHDKVASPARYGRSQGARFQGELDPLLNASFLGAFLRGGGYGTKWRDGSATKISSRIVKMWRWVLTTGDVTPLRELADAVEAIHGPPRDPTVDALLAYRFKLLVEAGIDLARPSPLNLTARQLKQLSRCP